jgi:hypothetical protein
VGGAAVKYDVYLRENAIKLQFASTDRNRVELAARLLRLAGVGAEVKKEGAETSGTSTPIPTSLRLGAMSLETPSPRSLGRRSRGAG